MFTLLCTKTLTVGNAAAFDLHLHRSSLPLEHEAFFLYGFKNGMLL